jgi:hypothetical protein
MLFSYDLTSVRDYLSASIIEAKSHPEIFLVGDSQLGHPVLVEPFEDNFFLPRPASTRGEDFNFILAFIVQFKKAVFHELDGRSDLY